MSQMSFFDFEDAGKRKQARRERFLAEMDQVVRWAGLLGLIEPFYPVNLRNLQSAKRCRLARRQR